MPANQVIAATLKKAEEKFSLQYAAKLHALMRAGDPSARQMLRAVLL